jgi:hypothetical protein
MLCSVGVEASAAVSVPGGASRLHNRRIPLHENGDIHRRLPA